jgi:putative SOS response-associated peptidase YedK
MCNDFGNRIPYSAYVEEFSELRLTLLAPKDGAVPNLEPRDEIWPTDTAPVLRPAPGGVSLAQLRWGLAPGRPGARAVINLRSEGRRFEQGRCLVPASHYYEFTGSKSPKTRWRFTRVGEAWFCFAGLIGRGEGGAEAFSLLTADAGPDVQPYHTRQPVVLDRSAWGAWLAGDDTRLAPSPAGSLHVEQAPREPTLL